MMHLGEAGLSLELVSNIFRLSCPYSAKNTSPSEATGQDMIINYMRRAKNAKSC